MSDLPVCTVLGAGTMGAQIALSLALGGAHVRLWARRAESLVAARTRCAAGLGFLASHGLVPGTAREGVKGTAQGTAQGAAREVTKAAGGRFARQSVKDSAAGGVLARISATPDLEEAVGGAGFVIEAVAEDLAVKQALLARAEACAGVDAVLSSTTSALSAARLQSVLERPENFCIAHYAQPAHLVELVEVVPGENTGDAAKRAVMDLLARSGKIAVLCPDIPGFLWARIQHAVLRECASLVGKGLVTPEACDKVLKSGYASRLPAMGAFEHADLAGLDLINSQAARAVWADLSNLDDPAATPVGALYARGDLGMKSGRGFYDWTLRDPEEFKKRRDEEIMRRVKINRGGRITL